ncbi:hypothetical protein WN944_017815 [Citrus x changshan-huyou]|uniref:Cytochrome P450 n=1 Tax=Citrus x changshan-huyou TaxID=2935761 RepID=A0AAP0MEG0_9ROSI
MAVVLGGVVLVVLFLLQHMYNALVLKPKKLRALLQKQGVKGPSPLFLWGNIFEIKRIQHQAAAAAKDQQKVGISHNWPPIAFAYLDKYRKDYGSRYIYSMGSIQIFCTTDVDLVKEINQCTSLSLGKPSYLSKDRGPLLGQGILATSGPLWVYQRKVIAPELYLERVKGMVKLMVDSTTSIVKSWESRIESEGGIAEIRVDRYMQSLAADVISRACFGSNYSKGQEIFSKFECLVLAMSKGAVGVPGLRYLPTRNNRDIWKLDKEINSMILQVVKERSQSCSHEKDLLQMILEGAKSCGNYNGVPLNISRDKFIVDNCKNIYFAGHETSAVTSSWALMLLAAYPEWQDRVRAEVLRVCKDRCLLDSTMLSSMKTLTMVIQETLRLYPPAGFVFREALDDIKFKDIVIPKGMGIQVPIPILQQNPEAWGSDAHEFNPERFANGVTAACKFPQAYMPFGAGPRACAGQHFALAELKVILSLLLSKFSFSLSPNYQHCPVVRVNIVPGNGIILHVRRV